MSRCTIEYEKFDKAFEELEIPPYTAAQEYYKAGWYKALEVLKDRLLSDGFYDIEDEDLPKIADTDRRLGYIDGYNSCHNNAINYIKKLEE